jgi:hypothetical protein
MIDLKIYKHCNKIETKFYLKSFTKLIKRPREEILGLDSQSDLIKRGAKALLI